MIAAGSCASASRERPRSQRISIDHIKAGYSAAAISSQYSLFL
jgi:hypothetical protein